MPPIDVPIDVPARCALAFSAPQPCGVLPSVSVQRVFGPHRSSRIRCSSAISHTCSVTEFKRELRFDSHTSRTESAEHHVDVFLTRGRAFLKVFKGFSCLFGKLPIIFLKPHIPEWPIVHFFANEHRTPRAYSIHSECVHSFHTRSIRNFVTNEID